jgi:hypothetical protein
MTDETKPADPETPAQAAPEAAAAQTFSIKEPDAPPARPEAKEMALEAWAAKMGIPAWLLAATRAANRFGEGKVLSKADAIRLFKATGDLKFHAHAPGPAPATRTVEVKPEPTEPSSES